MKLPVGGIDIRSWVVFFVVASATHAGVVRAAQRATVLGSPAPVHQYPNRTSPEVGRLSQGTEIPSSSDLQQDVYGEYWYKVRLDAGSYGYVRANELATEGTRQGLKQAGISQVEGLDGTRQIPWIFCLRAMGLGGTKLGFDASSSASLMPPEFSFGGEGEFTFTPLIGVHGYWHRFWSIGAAYQYVYPEQMIALSSVFRFYTERVWEPELRLRFGRSLSSETWLAGASFGIQFPFSLSARSYIAGYVELGGVTGIRILVDPIYAWLSAGLGFHF